MHQHTTAEKTNYGIKMGWIAIIGNILLFILKYIAGIISGSVALIADAWHTLSDSMSSVILIIGLKISKKPADEEHPFGHGRAEWVSSLIIALFLVIVGYSFIIESIERLESREQFEYGWIAWVATIVSLFVKEGMAQLSFYGAKKTGLQSLKADGWHHRTDSISSLVILVGLFLGPYFWWIDGVMGMVVSLMIFYAAYEIMKLNISNILGKKPDDETIEKIYAIIRENCQKDVNLHAIRIHHYGHHQEMTAHIKLPAHMSLQTAHTIANQIEEMILADLDIHATIHTEPLEV